MEAGSHQEGKYPWLVAGGEMQRVKILIEGRLDEKWAEWFEGFNLNYTVSGGTRLTGTVPDQAALYGLVAKLRDMGVRLISANLTTRRRRKAMKRKVRKRSSRNPIRKG